MDSVATHAKQVAGPDLNMASLDPEKGIEIRGETTPALPTTVTSEEPTEEDPNIVSILATLKFEIEVHM
ncbi:hypothetical protein NHQ30_005327 [Ciborinia camelliae]|nr:hypothetical protein NHQ30_005327 [Ciborinia camelliae]